MSDDVVIKIKADGKEADRWLKSFFDRSKKPVETKVRSAGGSSGSAGFKDEFRKAYGGGINESKDKGAKVSDAFLGGIDEGARGGSYNTLSSFGRGAKGAKDWAKGIAEKIKGNKEESEEGSGSHTSALANAMRSSGSRQQTVSAMTVRTATFQNVKGLGSGNGPGNSGSGSATDMGGSVEKIAQKATAIPFIGAVLGGVASAAAAGAGMAMKLVSNIGEKHNAAMMSQAGTTGSMGSYVGGGQGMFANSEVAQANLAMQRSRNAGQSSYFRQGNKIDAESMQFASAQGMGLSQVVESLGEVQRGWKEGSLSVLRGYTAASKMGFLKEGEFVQQLGSYAKGLRERGYGDMNAESGKSFLSLAAGIGSSVATPERGMTIAQNIDTGVRGTTGTLGNLGLMLGMRSGKSLDESMRASESGKMTGDVGKFLSTLPPEVRGMMMKQMGISSYTEGADVNLAGKGPVAQNAFQVGGNTAVAGQNRVEQAYAESLAAKRAAAFGQELSMDMLKMFQEHQKPMLKLIEGMQVIEDKLMLGANAMIDGVDKMIKKVTE
jgi:hypothetical protein